MSAAGEGPAPAPGTLIVLEGAEGAGKTTQLRRLTAAFEQHHIPALHLREPGGTDVGEAIRGLLLDPARTLTPAAEALLFMASRAQLVADRIRPALAAGTTVLLDRFFLSTYAYQIVGRGLPEAELRAANQLAVGGLVPDLTILLDLPPELGMARAASRNGDGGPDRMERAGDTFHQRVGAAFRAFAGAAWQEAHPECGAIVRIDALGTEDEVFVRIAQQLAAVRPETFGVLIESHHP